MIKSKLARHVAWKGQLKGKYEILVGKIETLKGPWKIT
jgi:hypothetical protein